MSFSILPARWLVGLSIVLGAWSAACAQAVVGSNVAAGDIAAVARQVDDIIRSGKLEAADVGSLGPQLERLPRAEAFDIRRRIAHAINTQQLVPTQSPFRLP